MTYAEPVEPGIPGVSAQEYEQACRASQLLGLPPPVHSWEIAERAQGLQHLQAIQAKKAHDDAVAPVYAQGTIIDPIKQAAEAQAESQLARGSLAFEQLQEQAIIQNQQASALQGFLVDEGVPQPPQGPVTVQDALIREGQGQYFNPSQLVNPPFQPAHFPTPVHLRPPHEYAAPSQVVVPRELRRGKSAPVGFIRDVDGNILRADTVLGVDVVAGSGSYAGATSKNVLAHTSLGDRVMAVATNADDLAEWYRDALMEYVAGATEELPPTPYESRVATQVA